METYYQKNKEKRLVYAKKYHTEHNEQKKEYQKKYRIKNAQKMSQYYINWYKEKGRRRSDNYIEKALEWKQAFPERVKIHRQIEIAIKTGKIIRPKICSKCGRKTKTQTHHLDYNDFMNFVWLCASCHKKEHTQKDFS